MDNACEVYTPVLYSERKKWDLDESTLLTTGRQRDKTISSFDRKFTILDAQHTPRSGIWGH